MSDEAFYRIKCANREEWLETRKHYIQASDAAAILGYSPWKNATQLYDEKAGLIEPKDISDKPYVIYGKKMEPFIREQFLLDCPYFSCDYHEFDILVSTERKWQGCTLDGELTVTSANPWNFPLGSKGILECKTGSWTKYTELREWMEFPLHYHAQQVHQLATTGWLFNVSASRIVRSAFKEEDGGFPEIRTLYHVIDRLHVEDDINTVNAAEAEFWKALEEGIRPAYTLRRI